MEKDELIMNERTHAGYLLLILEKIDKIIKKLNVKIKNKTI